MNSDCNQISSDPKKNSADAKKGLKSKQETPPDVRLPAAKENYIS